MFYDATYALEYRKAVGFVLLWVGLVKWSGCWLFPVSGVCLSSQVSKMSIDFDSAALQTQQEEEEYDQEDYAREQEVTVPLLNTAVISQ